MEAVETWKYSISKQALKKDSEARETLKQPPNLCKLERICFTYKDMEARFLYNYL